MKRLLLISSRNLYNTSGELRLVKNRTETLLNKYQVSTDFVVLKAKKVLRKPQEEIPNRSYKLFTHQIYDFKVREREMFHYLKDLIARQEEPFTAIVLSGVLVIPLVTKLKELTPSTKFFADLHGAFEELIEFPDKSLVKDLGRKAYYRIAKRNEKRYLKEFDGFYSVSNALKNYIETEYQIQGKPFFIIPCGIPQTEVEVESSLANRTLFRSKYGLEKNDILFIYSGGVSPWQCIEESVKMFERLKSNTSKRVKLLLLSGNKAAIERFKSEDVFIDSYSGEEVRKVLCAGDFAFMLRQDLVTNNVAYPNKFLEYVSAGLQVISTTAVRDIAEQIMQYKVGHIVDLNGEIEPQWLESFVPYLQDAEQRNALLKATSFETTLAPFVEFIEKR